MIASVCIYRILRRDSSDEGRSIEDCSVNKVIEIFGEPLFSRCPLLVLVLEVLPLDSFVLTVTTSADFVDAARSPVVGQPRRTSGLLASA